MTFRQDLTPGQHVARREALAQMARGHDLTDGLLLLAEKVMLPLVSRFADGHRLDGHRFEALVNEIRSVVLNFGPPLVTERRRPPTKAKPKSEEHEFLAVTRCAAEAGEGTSGYELVGIRIFLNRRRIMFTSEANGIYVTKHAMERSIERGLASWTGRLSEVEDAMLDNMGLGIVWRHAFETGLVHNPAIALPCGRGLMLGTLSHNHFTRGSMAMGISGSRADSLDLDPSALLVHPLTHAASARVDTILRTAVDEDLLGIEQVDLRDALMRFRSINEAFLSDLTTSALWRSATIQPTVPTDVLFRLLDQAAADLAGLLARNGAHEALGGRPVGVDVDPGATLPVECGSDA